MMRTIKQICLSVIFIAISISLNGCMTVGYSYAKNPNLTKKWNVTITKVEPQNIYNSTGVFWVGPLAKVESKGLRVAFVTDAGESAEIVQPSSDRFELKVGQKAVYIANKGQIWVQPVDYPLPPEFTTTPPIPIVEHPNQEVPPVTVPNKGSVSEKLRDLQFLRKDGVIAYSTETGHSVHGKLDSRSVATRGLFFTPDLRV